MSVVVPYTPILRLYHEVIAKHDRDRFDFATELNADGGARVATAFEDSVAILGKQYKNSDSFRPKPKLPKEPEPHRITKGWHLAWYLREQHELAVRDHPALSVEWADYELSVLSTRGGAVFDQPKHGTTAPEHPNAGNALKADLVMVNPQGRFPVIGEVKVARDKEPFSALIQLLAYIAHLAPPRQYERLCTHVPADYPAAKPARFDGYVMLFQFGQKWDKAGERYVPSPNTWLDRLAAQAQLLSAQLVFRSEIKRHVRRLACLDVELNEAEQLEATCRWLHVVRRRGG